MFLEVGEQREDEWQRKGEGCSEADTGRRKQRRVKFPFFQKILSEEFVRCLTRGSCPPRPLSVRRREWRGERGVPTSSPVLPLLTPQRSMKLFSTPRYCTCCTQLGIPSRALIGERTPQCMTGIPVSVRTEGPNAKARNDPGQPATSAMRASELHSVGRCERGAQPR